MWWVNREGPRGVLCWEEVRALEREANSIEVRDAWDAIASRLLESSGPSLRLSPVGEGARRRRVRAVAGICVGVAAALLLAIVLGWRPFATTTPEPIGPPNTSVPRYDLTIPTLVVCRSNVEVIAQNQPKGSTLSITPERMRTDSRDVGFAALTAMFETKP